MNLDDLLNEIREKMKNRDLSDDYLKEHGNSTRGEIGIGEYSYGITTIPCEWVYKYLSDYKRLQEEFKQVDHECERLEQKELRLEKENEEWQRAYQEEKDKQFDLLRENQKLQKENEELKVENDILKTNYSILKGDIQKVVNKLGFPEDTIISDEFIPMINENYFPKEKIQDKIEELENYKGLVIYERCNYKYIIELLQDLLEEKGE